MAGQVPCRTEATLEKDDPNGVCDTRRMGWPAGRGVLRGVELIDSCPPLLEMHYTI